jgi:hypothetical protein
MTVIGFKFRTFALILCFGINCDLTNTICNFKVFKVDRMIHSKISSSGVYVGVVGLQAAVMVPQICKGIILLNISLRMLHITKQPWFGKPLIRSFQSLLRYKFDQ